MRVFVTGATGFIGSAIVRDLLQAGHHVIGLARSEAGMAAVVAAGAEAFRGDIDDLESLRRGAALADGVIHTAFNHNFATFAANCAADRGVIEALGDGLDSADKALVVTSGTALVSGARPATETDAPPADATVIPRVASEEAADAVAARGPRVSIVRLAPSVHGDGDHGFVPLLIALARDKGTSAYVGEGGNVWPAVHRFDAARLFRLVLERGARGARYHGSAEAGVPFRDIASVIGRRLDVPVVSLTPEQAAAHFGWFKGFAALDNPASSARTQRELGWTPSQPGLIADLDRPQYFGA